MADQSPAACQCEASPSSTKREQSFFSLSVLTARSSSLSSLGTLSQESSIMEEPNTPRTPATSSLMRLRLATLPAEFSLSFDRDERAARSPAEVHRQVMCNKGNRCDFFAARAPKQPKLIAGREWQAVELTYLVQKSGPRLPEVARGRSPTGRERSSAAQTSPQGSQDPVSPRHLGQQSFRPSAQILSPDPISSDGKLGALARAATTVPVLWQKGQTPRCTGSGKSPGYAAGAAEGNKDFSEISSADVPASSRSVDSTTGQLTARSGHAGLSTWRSGSRRGCSTGSILENEIFRESLDSAAKQTQNQSSTLYSSTGSGQSAHEAARHLRSERVRLRHLKEALASGQRERGGGGGRASGGGRWRETWQRENDQATRRHKHKHTHTARERQKEEEERLRLRGRGRDRVLTK